MKCCGLLQNFKDAALLARLHAVQASADYTFADSMMDENGAIVYENVTPGTPAASKSAGAGKLVSTTRAQADPAGAGGSGTVMAYVCALNATYRSPPPWPLRQAPAPDSMPSHC